MALKPPVEVPQGAIRLNTDSQKLEFYAQDQWWEMATDVPNLGRSTDNGAGARGLFSGGRSSNVIQYITIPSGGNASDFGDTTESSREGGAASSRTRGLTCGSYPAYSNVIDYVTFATTGNAQDFGDSPDSRRSMNSCSSETRGVWLGGIDGPGAPTCNIIDFVTIASTGNAVDYGDLETTSNNSSGNAGSPTRGLCLGGTPSTTGSAQYITIATTGNSSTFGDLNAAQGNRGACSNSIRALHGYENNIEYITIATTGNSVDFGDNSFLQRSLAACTNSLRAVYGGGNDPSATLNTLSYVTIATTGNGQDFGDLIGARNLDSSVGSSDSHGGLSE